MRHVLKWFYCLNIPTAILALSAASVVFLFLLKRFCNKGWWYWLLGLTLCCWAALVVCTTLIDRESTQQVLCDMTPFHSYWAVFSGGNRENLRSNFMNVALFYPGGFVAVHLLPKKWPRWVRFLLVTMLLGYMSIGIECTQYCYMLGRCEIDDVIHNTLGALIGSVISLRLKFCSAK